VLEQRRTVAKTLLALAVSQGDPLQAAREFADFNKADVWLWISGWMGGLARAQLSGEAPADPVVEAIQKYRPALSAARALQLAEQAGRARNMVDWPVREDLLLADWLIQWQSRN
jgi:hypothetical protein